MSVSFLSVPVDGVSTKQIRPASIPIRTDLGNIEQLCASIKEIGLLQPIILRSRNDHFEVVAGNRRFEACKRLRWRRIPSCIVELDDKQAYEVALSENLDRKSLDVLEEARAYKKYVDQAGWGGLAELSSKIGRSQSYISKKIKLLSLEPSLLDQISQRQQSVSIAEEILSLDISNQVEISRTLQGTQLSSREVRKLVRAIKEANAMRGDLSGSETSLPPYPGEMTSWELQKERKQLVLRCVDQTIAAMRLALSRLDNVLDKLEKEWVEREIMMQYRLSLHGQIDSLIRFRKKLSISEG